MGGASGGELRAQGDGPRRSRASACMPPPRACHARPRQCSPTTLTFFACALPLLLCAQELLGSESDEALQAGLKQLQQQARRQGESADEEDAGGPPTRDPKLLQRLMQATRERLMQVRVARACVSLWERLDQPCKHLRSHRGRAAKQGDLLLCARNVHVHSAAGITCLSSLRRLCARMCRWWPAVESCLTSRQPQQLLPRCSGWCPLTSGVVGCRRSWQQQEVMTRAAQGGSSQGLWPTHVTAADRRTASCCAVQWWCREGLPQYRHNLCWFEKQMCPAAPCMRQR